MKNNLISDFLDANGWPNPEHNFDIDLINTLKAFLEFIVSENIDNEIFNEKFLDVDLSKQIRLDIDGTPVIRNCFEYETLMSFHDDDDNKAFNEWWHEKGAYFFNMWLKNKK